MGVLNWRKTTYGMTVKRMCVCASANGRVKMIECHIYRKYKFQFNQKQGDDFYRRNVTIQQGKNKPQSC